MEKNFFAILILAVCLMIPSGAVLADYNTIVWGPQTVLYFSGVAAETGGSQGVSVNINGDTFLHKYTLDINKLAIEMYPGSKISLKSNDKKMFRTDIATADTVCGDSYSTFDYATPQTYANFTITLTDGDNCPSITATKAEENEIPTTEQIDVTNLDQITTGGLLKKLSANSKTHFVYGNIVETVEVLSLGSTETKIKLSAPDKEITLSANQEKTVDTDSDGWNDLSLELKSIQAGQAEIMMKRMNVIKVDGINPGDLVKVAGGTTVYYVGANSKLYVFPNEKVYNTWYNDFSAVKTISSEDLGKFGWGGLVTYKPGVKMVKFTISSDVYVVEKGGVLLKLKDEIMAKDLYGDDWNKKIDDINEAFMFSYSFGRALTEAGEFVPEEANQLTPTVGVDKGT